MFRKALSSYIFFSVIALHYRNPFAGQVRQTLNPGVILTDKKCAVQGQVRDSEIIQSFPLRCAADQRQYIQPTLGQFCFDLIPWRGFKGNFSAHGFDGGLQQFDRKSICTAVRVHD